MYSYDIILSNNNLYRMVFILDFRSTTVYGRRRMKSSRVPPNPSREVLTRVRLCSPPGTSNIYDAANDLYPAIPAVSYLPKSVEQLFTGTTLYIVHTVSIIYE